MSKTHDFRDDNRGWGHDYTFTPIEGTGGRRAKAYGWCSGIKKQDYLVLSNGDGETRYRVIEIEYCRDPDDMWFAELIFDPRDSASA